MTKLYRHSHPRRSLRRLLPIALALTAGLGACNSDSDTTVQTGYVEPDDVAVTGFSLKADIHVLRGLDSVFFSIDLDRGMIYNADSLPKNTRITDLIPVIKYSSYISSAKIEMEGGIKRTGEVDYKAHPNDSIDFTGNVKLILTTTTGTQRSYQLKVNVHESEPDSLCWGPSAVSKLPARTPNPAEQRTVRFKDDVITLVKEEDGTYTIANTADPATEKWAQNTPLFGFTPRVRTLTATTDKLWILTTDGALQSSTDGINWQATGRTWQNIIGAYGSHLLGLTEMSGSNGYRYESEDGAFGGALPTGFPVDDYSDMYSYRSKWMASPVSILVGGVTATGAISSAVWAYDGESWACLSQGAIPALRGAVMVPYYTYRRQSASWNYTEYSTMLLLGGMTAEGILNRTTYISYDNGVNWSTAGTLLTLPDYIPSTWNCDNVIIFKPMQAPLLPPGWKEIPARRVPSYYRVNASVSDDMISWECPYIYLFGGCNSDGVLYNTIWRGVITRLTFAPII